MALTNPERIRGTSYFVPRTSYLFSWSYWFGSRTQGLLIHPYITMREIVREHFLRPLTLIPIVMWIMSWIVAVFIGRLGLFLSLNHQLWTIPVGKFLVFIWVCFSCFVLLWQILLTYLYLRFRITKHKSTNNKSNIKY